MKSIWKFPLGITDSQHVLMPTGARILCVQSQRDTPCLWALVDTDVARVGRMIHMRGTGHNAEDVQHLPYVGTFQVEGGSLVFHVFDGGE